MEHVFIYFSSPIFTFNKCKNFGVFTWLGSCVDLTLGHPIPQGVSDLCSGESEGTNSGLEGVDYYPFLCRFPSFIINVHLDHQQKDQGGTLTPMFSIASLFCKISINIISI